MTARGRRNKTMSDKKKPDNFNDKQWEAIQYSASKDLLISAGAGSGKTKTLSERVKRLIADKEIDPSALLVLTFTDNAAHEMKERIVSLFAKDPSTASLAGRMQSCHIQTFDSFCQYLVSTYAGRLGLSSAVSVLDESIEKAKKREFLDQTIEEFLSDSEKGEAVKDSFAKFNTNSLDATKSVILDLDGKLHNLLPQDRKDFFDNYEEVFCDKEKFFRQYDSYIERIKDELRFALLKANYIDYFQDDENTAFRPFESTSFFEAVSYIAREQEFCAPYAQEITRLLGLSSEEFVKACKEDLDNKKLIKQWPKKKKNKDEDVDADSLSEDDEIRAKKVFNILKNVFKTQKATLAPVYNLGSKEEEYERFLSFKDDAAILLNIVKEMWRKLDEYKRAVNCFTFSDISSFALSLLQEEQFADVAEEIRSRFDYIMVDEYQDTNDSQEAFLNSLLSPNKKGKRAHLFCVGDPKQAIYGFRNSNVKLFIGRQKSLGSDCLIHMNTNYRSGEKLLIEINTLFKAYMSKDHGDVDYTDPNEQLGYDKKVDLYGLPYAHFGISRIISRGGKYDGKAPLDWEIAAIIDDIKTKINDPEFLVYDAGTPGKQRRAKYSDFVILCRKKAPFLDFQKAFVEADLPLNITVSNNLRDISCVLALESLVAFFLAIENNATRDIPHLFASLARSYLFEYSDEKLFSILAKVSSEKGKDPLGEIRQDPIYVQAADFVSAHKDADFPTLFRDMLDEFRVVSYLYKLGDVSDNMSKISALYDLAIKQTKMGEGMGDFVGLFSSIKKYQLNFESQSSFAAENSVDLMTIHASKGLERKIVYMPVSQNRETGGGPEGPDYAFSTKYGILLPDYSFSEDIKETNHSVYSLPYRLFKLEQGLHDSDTDEHVRLFYVAFTRAQSSLIIVGDDCKRKEEDLYDALDHLPHQKIFNPKLYEDKVSSGVLSKDAYARYLDLIKQRQSVPDLRLEDFKTPGKDPELTLTQFRWYQKLREETVIADLTEQIDECFSNMEYSLFEHYLARLKKCGDIDTIAKVYACYKGYSVSVSSLSNLDEYCSQRGLLEEEGTSMKDGLLRFQEDLVYLRAEPLGVSIKKNSDESEKNKRFVDAFLSPLCLAFDNYDYVSRNSYENPGFGDPVSFYSYSENEQKGDRNNPLEGMGDVVLSQEAILFPETVKKRASKKKEYADEDSPVMAAINKGIELHRYMEMVDFSSKDTSFIVNPRDRARISQVLSSPFFNDLSGCKIYKEYGYYDEQNDTTGFIDLLIEKDGEYLIVDYKSKNISDPAYVEQLRVYRENVSKLFNVPLTKIRAYLLPLNGESIHEVEFE